MAVGAYYQEVDAVRFDGLGDYRLGRALHNAGLGLVAARLQRGLCVGQPLAVFLYARLISAQPTSGGS